MKVRRAAGAAVVLTLTVGLIGTASAQRGNRGGQGNFGGGGMQGAPMMGRMPQVDNPLMSNLMGLLQRTDVQNEIVLGLKQKMALEDLSTQSQQDMRTQMQQTMRAARNNGNNQNPRNMTQEERQQQMQQMQDQIQQAMAQFQGELTEKVKAILKPEQVKRLEELDLQRRGVLALADTKVADKVKVTPEHRGQIQPIVSEWQAQNQQTIGDTMQEYFRGGGMRSGAPMPDPTNRLAPLGKKVYELRKAAESKVLDLLSDEEKANWKTVQGAPFTFRDTFNSRSNTGR